MILTFALTLLLQGDIILDRDPLLTPVLDGWVDENGKFQSLILLKKYKDGSHLALIQPQDWEWVMDSLKKDQLSITRTPLEIRVGDRFSEKGGAMIVVALKQTKFPKPDCKKPPEKGWKCWSIWVKERQDKPDFAPFPTWDIAIPRSEKAYGKRVQTSIQDRLDALEKVTIPRLKSDFVEAKKAKLTAATMFYDLNCHEEKYISDKHFKDCQYAYDEYQTFRRECDKIESQLMEYEMECDDYRATIAEIGQIIKEEEGKKVEVVKP